MTTHFKFLHHSYVFVLTNLVSVALDEHSFLGLLWFSLASVLAELSKWVGLGTGEQSILSCLDILWPATPCLQAGVLESSGIRERNVPWVGTLVHGVQVEGCLNLRLPTRQELQNMTCFNALVNDFAKAFALELGKWRFSFMNLPWFRGQLEGFSCEGAWVCTQQPVVVWPSPCIQHQEWPC